MDQRSHPALDRFQVPDSITSGVRPGNAPRGTPPTPWCPFPGKEYVCSLKPPFHAAQRKSEAQETGDYISGSIR